MFISISISIYFYISTKYCIYTYIYMYTYICVWVYTHTYKSGLEKGSAVITVSILISMYPSIYYTHMYMYIIYLDELG